MKKTYKLIVSLLFVFFLGTTQAFSQDLDSLLQHDTIAAAHLNLKNFDFDRLLQSRLDQIDSLFQKLNYDSDSREAIGREVKTLIAGKLSLIRPVYQMYIMATKLDEIYVLSYAEGLETVPVIVATPLEGKTKNQIALIESFFNDAPIKPFQSNGFLILAVPYSPDKGEEAARWVAEHLLEKPAPDNIISVVNEAFQEMSEDTLFRAVVMKPENIQELLDRADLSNVPPQARVIFDMFLEKFQWVSFGVNPYELSAGLTIQTSSEADAGELLELLKSTQDAGIAALRTGLHGGIAMGAQDNPGLVFLSEYVPLATEIARGAIRQTLPRIDGAKLIFSCQ